MVSTPPGQPAGPSEGPTGNLGDGDLADPGIVGIDDDELADVPSASHDVVDVSSAGDDDDVRASEIDDITDSLSRPNVGEFDASQVDVAALLAEREQFKSMAQRLQADFDNYRKRTNSQAQADADRAASRLAEALLPVLDAAEAAYLNHPDEVGPLLNQMLGELKKQGLETLDLEHQPFDPEVAEAVAHEPGTGGEPVVAEVLRSGYRWKGKTLRAAMVKTTD
jgi:molecular chaperone GrpE